MISRFKNVLHLTLVKGFVTCEQNIYKQQRLGQGTEGEEESGRPRYAIFGLLTELAVDKQPANGMKGATRRRYRAVRRIYNNDTSSYK